MIEPVEITVVSVAGLKETFETFTQDIDAWWPTEKHSVAQGTVIFEPGMAGRVVETAGTGQDHIWGHVTDWHEFQCISLSWYPGSKPEAGTQVTIRFAPADGGRTYVTLTHSGWGGSDEDATNKRDNYRSGWESILNVCFSEYIAQSINLNMKSNRKIRPYNPTDTEALIAIWEDADGLAHSFLPKAVRYQVRDDIRNIYLPGAETWVIAEEDKPAGFISMAGTEIGGLFVATDKHGKGLGRHLVDHVVALKGPLSVEVFRDNRPGRQFYRKYGFVTLEEGLFELSGHTTLKMAMPGAQT